MATQFTKKFVQRRFERFCDEMGLSRDCWSKNEEGGNVAANRGAVYLDHAACFGGYQINQIMNEGGGVRIITGWANRMSGRELDNWMEGALWTKRHLIGDAPLPFLKTAED